MRWKAAALAAGLVTVSLSACSDELPTLSDPGGLATGQAPTTIEWEFPTSSLLKGLFVIDGGTRASDASYRVVANRFDGVLDSHVLTRFGELPDTVETLDGTDTIQSFIDGQIVSTVADTAAVQPDLIDFELWTVTQDWDSTAVSWENAVDTPGAVVPWMEPGGTRGQLIAVTRWERADTTARGDSLIWNVNSDVVRSIASGELKGLMVTLAQPDSRAQIGTLVLRANLRPTIDNDTVLTRSYAAGRHNMIFTPEPPQPADLIRIGGVTSDRTFLRFDLTQPVPVCQPATAQCGQYADLSDVSLNRVELILEPVRVTSGFRPLRGIEFNTRVLFEPELNERATLGPIAQFDSLSVAQGAGSSTPVRINVTNAVQLALADSLSELGVGLLVEPDLARFDYGWFRQNPRLRFLYTLRQVPQLP